jgi:hypothetical protein
MNDFRGVLVPDSEEKTNLGSFSKASGHFIFHYNFSHIKNKMAQ